MEASSSSPSPPFTVTRQDDSSTYDPNNPNARQWTINFTTPSGVESQVILPESDYTPQNVYAAIMAKVTTIEAVHNLGAAGAPD